MTREACLAVMLLATACSKAPDKSTAGNVADPVIAEALADPLMTDLGLDRRSNADALRPPDEPYRATTPPDQPDPLREGAAPTVAARAADLIALHAPMAFAGCGKVLRYSAIWAATLPPELALPGPARVGEAAGSDAPTCRYRVVGYAAAVPVATLIGDLRNSATRAGYAVTAASRGKAQVIIGRRTRDGAVLIVAVDTPAGDDVLVDVVTNRGV